MCNRCDLSTDFYDIMTFRQWLQPIPLGSLQYFQTYS